MKPKNKYFPYGYYRREVLGYCPRTKEPIYQWKSPNSFPKKIKFTTPHKVLIIILLLTLGLFLSGCSSTPIVDSRGKSSANIDGDMNRYHDDYYTCESLVKDNTNVVLDQAKSLYNGLRWRVLWLSPKIQTRQDLINNCLEGRGYNVLNK